MTSYSDTGTIIHRNGSRAAEAEVRGATMAVHASVGIAGGVLGSLAIGATLQAAGGKDSADAWTAAFLAMAMGSAFGYVIRWWYGRKQEAYARRHSNPLNRDSVGGHHGMPHGL